MTTSTWPSRAVNRRRVAGVDLLTEARARVEGRVITAKALVEEPAEARITVPNPLTRETALAFACGSVCSLLVWIFAHPFAPWVPFVGGCTGVAYQRARAHRGGRIADSALSAATLAIPLWAILEVIVVPLFGNHAPAWSPAEARAILPALIGWMLFGCALGTTMHLAVGRSARLEGSAAVQPPRAAHRIVILGGGFAGMTTAVKLEEAFGRDRSVEITLVSDSNALLFTPMLAEVAGSSVQPANISSPLRTSLRRTRVVRARVSGIDLDGRYAELAPDDGTAAPQRLRYDHLILALGSVSHFFGQEDIRRVALEFKSLRDAVRIRNHVIASFERADREQDESVRRRLLTFVIAGGGFAGVELAGALNDFARGILIDYPTLVANEVSVIVVQAEERILPELSETLAAYAHARMAERGVHFILNTRVTSATPNAVILEGNREIAASTLVWTAGTAPNPLAATLDLAKSRRGALAVDAHLAIPNRLGLWALGDCAAIPNGTPGGTYPPTAQHAVREAATLAHNIRAALRGEPLRGFSFESPGSMCVIGHQIACVEIRAPLLRRKLLFSGVFAWLLWRAIYLGKLPGFERKARVLIDWVAELFFPKDTVQLFEST
jgi:NADH dehydrogenase